MVTDLASKVFYLLSSSLSPNTWSERTSHGSTTWTLLFGYSIDKPIAIRPKEASYFRSFPREAIRFPNYVVIITSYRERMGPHEVERLATVNRDSASPFTISRNKVEHDWKMASGHTR